MGVSGNTTNTNSITCGANTNKNNTSNSSADNCSQRDHPNTNKQKVDAWFPYNQPALESSTALGADKHNRMDSIEHIHTDNHTDTYKCPTTSNTLYDLPPNKDTMDPRPSHTNTDINTVVSNAKLDTKPNDRVDSDSKPTNAITNNNNLDNINYYNSNNQPNYNNKYYPNTNHCQTQHIQLNHSCNNCKQPNCINNITTIPHTTPP